jgi:rhodanese-related sulfurtransferase
MSRKHPQSTHPSSQPASYRGRKTSRRSLAWLWVSLGALFVVGIGIILIRPGNNPTPESTSPQASATSVEITPAQAYAKYQQGAFFLDVRSQAEWDQYHIARSILIPLDQLQNRLSELPKDQEIVVVCLSGHRSLSGTTILLQAGFTHVSCLSGGLQAWMAANYPVEGNNH